MDYMTVKEAGAAWGVSARMATIYCEQGRVPGALKKGNVWLLPGGSLKPSRQGSMGRCFREGR